MTASKKPSTLKKSTTLKKSLIPIADDKKYLCPYCLKEKAKEGFYQSSDPEIRTGITIMCKQCAYDRAIKKDDNGNDLVTKDSIMGALERLDKPYLEKLYDSSYMEVHNQENEKGKSNIWTAYIKNVSMVNYKTMRWRDGDMFKGANRILMSAAAIPFLHQEDKSKQDIIWETYEQNKKDAVRLLGYDPFDKETEADKPYLYSQLIRYCDSSEDANEDGMMLSSIIEIIKDFNQTEKLNNVIALLMSDVTNMATNISTIKSLEETKNKIMASALALAKDNGISIKHSVNSSKGSNTWTGKVKELKERNLREAEVNLFDVGTCEGMRQIAEISNAAILKQIRLDENDYTEMIKDQAKLIQQYKVVADKAEEQARLLLRENVDLKSFLKEQGLLDIAEAIDVTSVEVTEYAN